jgi:hypothetical protein
MIAAVTGEPAQRLHQFWRQLDATGIDLEAAIKNPALTSNNIKKTARGHGVENVAPLIFYFFKTATPALFAAAVPI